MPDFNIQTAYTCATNRHWAKRYQGSKPGVTYLVEWGPLPPNAPYQYGWHCECKGFQFGKSCKHTMDAAKHRCAWNFELEPCAKPAPNGTCPDCGGPLEAERVAV